MAIQHQWKRPQNTLAGTLKCMGCDRYIHIWGNRLHYADFDKVYILNKGVLVDNGIHGDCAVESMRTIMES